MQTGKVPLFVKIFSLFCICFLGIFGGCAIDLEPAGNDVCKNVTCQNGKCETAKVVSTGEKFPVCKCNEGYSLEPGSYEVCVKTCKINRDCGPGQVCKQYHPGAKVLNCFDVQCRGDIDCTKGQICKDYECIVGCTQDNDCVPGNSCQDGACKKAPTACKDGRPVCTCKEGYTMRYFDAAGSLIVNEDTAKAIVECGQWPQGARSAIPVYAMEGKERQICYELPLTEWPVVCVGAKQAELSSNNATQREHCQSKGKHDLGFTIACSNK